MYKGKEVRQTRAPLSMTSKDSTVCGLEIRKRKEHMEPEVQEKCPSVAATCVKFLILL